MAAIAKGGPAPAMTAAAERDYARDLQAWQVKTVIVGPMANQEQMVSFFSALVGYPPTEEGGVAVWFGL